MKIKNNSQLILASTSWGRKYALKQAELQYKTIKPIADEEAFKDKVKHLPISEQALELGRIKGEEVSLQNPNAYIICGDQITEIDGKPHGKPKDTQHAVRMLMRQSGKTVILHTSVLLMKNGQIEWSFVDTPSITMRNYSTSEAQAYVNSDPEVIHCTGAMKIEGMGMHLIEKIEGEFFSIVGLPIHPLLAQLYQQNIIEITE